MNIDFNKYFDLSNLSTEQQEILIGSITDLVLARMADKISDYLTESEITELENLGQEQNGDAVINWLNQHVPNFSQGVEEILAEESVSIAQKITMLTNSAMDEA